MRHRDAQAVTLDLGFLLHACHERFVSQIDLLGRPLPEILSHALVHESPVTISGFLPFEPNWLSSPYTSTPASSVSAQFQSSLYSCSRAIVQACGPYPLDRLGYQVVVIAHQAVGAANPIVTLRHSQRSGHVRSPARLSKCNNARTDPIPPYSPESFPKTGLPDQHYLAVNTTVSG